jgi:DNA-binding transcriptional regulator YiaG
MSRRHPGRGRANTDQLPTLRATLAWLITHITTPDREETATFSMTNDLTTLRAEITRLRRALTVLRTRYANLLAAVRAAVAAHEDGEVEPMAYLYDELPDHPLHAVLKGDSHDDAGTAGSDK